MNTFFVFIIIFSLLFTSGLSIFFYYKNTRLHFIFKPLPIVAMIIYFIVFCHGSLSDHFNYLILLALLFCVFGDLFIVYDKYFFYGILSFLCTQIIYSLYFLLNVTHFYPIILAVLIVIGLLAFISLIPGHNDDFSGRIIPACLIYTLALSIMVGLAICYDISRHGHISVMSVGAILFLISDGILSLFQFKTRSAWLYFFVLTFYYASQILMPASLLIEKL